MKLTRESMSEFAEMLAKIIHFAAIKNKSANLDLFCNESILHQIVLSLCDHIANHAANFFPKSVEKHSHRGYLKKAAIFCMENQTVYFSQDTKLEKYGLVTFRDKESWSAFKHLQPHKLFTKKPLITIENLQQHSFFSQEEQDADSSRADYDNDAYFNPSH